MKEQRAVDVRTQPLQFVIINHESSFHIPMFLNNTITYIKAPLLITRLELLCNLYTTRKRYLTRRSTTKTTY